MGKSNRDQVLFQAACDRVKQHESLLFQRLNYFLISIAFLIAAFVQLALNTSNHSYPIALLVGIAGVLLSWIYTAINFSNAKILKIVYENANSLEKKYFKGEKLKASELPMNFVFSSIFESSKFKVDWKTYIYDCIRGSAQTSFNTGQKDYIPSPHTWMIPYFFIVFWLAALVLYFIFFLKPIYGFTIPFIVLLYVLHPLLYKLVLQIIIRYMKLIFHRRRV